MKASPLRKWRIAGSICEGKIVLPCRPKFLPRDKSFFRGSYPHERTLTKDFEAHFGAVHIREDASQAAARIVREATEE
jgi:hypothetical protein